MLCRSVVHQSQSIGSGSQVLNWVKMSETKANSLYSDICSCLLSISLGQLTCKAQYYSLMHCHGDNYSTMLLATYCPWKFGVLVSSLHLLLAMCGAWVIIIVSSDLGPPLQPHRFTSEWHYYVYTVVWLFEVVQLLTVYENPHRILVCLYPVCRCE